MPLSRPTWHRVTQKNSIPGLPCPHCETGKLRVAEGRYIELEPKYSVHSRHNNPEDWDPYRPVGRWSATLICDESACGEVVNMIGDMEAVETEDALGDGTITWGLEDVLRIQAVFPAPPMFKISEAVPHSVKSELNLAFRMYWTDVSACAARLRTAVERLLDDQNVPKEKLAKNNKLHRMNLEQRINSFTSGAVHNEQLQGLRNVGNLGTHGKGDVDDVNLFDALDVLEFVLTGVYDLKTINAKATNLKQKKPNQA